MNEMKIIKGRATKKIKRTFHEAISFTSFFVKKDIRNKNIRKVKKGRKITTPIRSHKSMVYEKRVIVYLTGI